MRRAASSPQIHQQLHRRRRSGCGGGGPSCHVFDASSLCQQISCLPLPSCLSAHQGQLGGSKRRHPVPSWHPQRSIRGPWLREQQSTCVPVSQSVGSRLCTLRQKSLNTVGQRPPARPSATKSHVCVCVCVNAKKQNNDETNTRCAYYGVACAQI